MCPFVLAPQRNCSAERPRNLTGETESYHHTITRELNPKRTVPSLDIHVTLMFKICCFLMKNQSLQWTKSIRENVNWSLLNLEGCVVWLLKEEARRNIFSTGHFTVWISAHSHINTVVTLPLYFTKRLLHFFLSYREIICCYPIDTLKEYTFKVPEPNVDIISISSYLVAWTMTSGNLRVKGRISLEDNSSLFI